MVQGSSSVASYQTQDSSAECCAEKKQLHSRKAVALCLSGGTNTERNAPEAEAVGAALLGAAFLGVSDLGSDLLANWEPTALSKNPPPATQGPSAQGQPDMCDTTALHRFKEDVCQAAHQQEAILMQRKSCTSLLRVASVVSNMPEAEAVGGFLGAAFLGVSGLDSDLLANCDPTALSKKPPPAHRVIFHTTDMPDTR